MSANASFKQLRNPAQNRLDDESRASARDRQRLAGSVNHD